MWPILLDMTKDECKRSLRRLELEAYGNIVSALRAQGGLTTDKNKLLQDVASTLNIPQERHRAEIRRAVNDERLATIAHCMTGDDSSDEWALEGRRLIPLMPRLAPQTAYSVIADDEANKVSLENEKLPLPANTERKRPLQTSTTETLNKNVSHRERDVHFRMPSESSSKSSMQKINMDEIVSKKRKSSMNMESSSLAQHLMMAQPKLSRVQQLYRQKTKAILKSQMKQRPPPPIPHIQKMNVMKQQQHQQQQQQQQQHQQQLQEEEPTHSNSIQEVPIQIHQQQQQQITIPKQQQIENKILNQVTIATSETQTLTTKSSNKPTIISTTIIKPGNTSTNANTNNNVNNNINTNSSSSSSNINNNTIIPQQPVVSSSTSSEVAQQQTTQQKSIKICPARKVITTSARTPTTPQKVIIVSTPQGQGTTNPSILQRTLSSIPFMKTISMKSLDKVKVINSPNLQNTNTGTTQKPKLLTVQTKTKGGTPGKQVSIPFIQGVQLQALQNKGAIKMLPLTTQTKGTTKPTIISTTAGSVYIMNSNTTLPIVTSSNTTPVVSTKTETNKNNNDLDAANNTTTTTTTTTNVNVNSSNIIILKNELIKPATPIKNKTDISQNNDNSISEAEQLKKSSVLAEILKASGVLPNDYNDPNDNDIESQISQLTEIPNANTHNNNNNNNTSITTTSATTTTTTITTNTNTHTINTNINLNLNKENLKTDEIELKSEYLEEEIITNENIEIVMKNDNVQIDIKNEHLDHELTNEHFQTIIHENCQNETEVHFDESVMDVTQDSANFVILEETEDHTETIIMDETTETEEVVELMGSLDPETGMYSMKTPQEYELIDQVVNIETSQSDSTELNAADQSQLQSQSQIVHSTHQLPPDSYIIEMQMESLHSSDLDMPSLSN